MLSQDLEIRAFPRLHITLIGMNNSGYRVNGGIGFAIEAPSITAKVSKAAEFAFIDNRANAFSVLQYDRLKRVIDNTFYSKKFKHNISVNIDGELYTHSGLGSGTIIRLLCLESIYLLNNAEYEEDVLIQLSGRGGTSGIGIQTYFHGGLVFDIGHRNFKQELLPSSAVEERSMKPLLVDNCKMPEWEIGLCFPDSLNYCSEAQEKEFFKRVIPISQASVAEILYQVTYGVYGSIRDSDKTSFEIAINKIQKLVWKDAERSVYGDRIATYEKDLFKSGATCVGMSSLGPCLFFTAISVDDVVDKMKRSGHLCTLIKTKPINRGRIIQM